MAKKKDGLAAEVSLLIGIDRQSYNQTRTRLAEMMEDQKLGLDLSVLDDLAGKLRSTLQSVGKGVDAAVRSSFDAKMGDQLKEFRKKSLEIAAVRDEIEAGGSEGEVSALKERMSLLVEERAIIEARYNEANETFKNQAKAARELQDAMTPSVPGMVKGGERMADSFTASINQIKSGDLPGLISALGGVFGAAGEKGAKALSLMSASAATEDAAAGLGKAAGAVAVIGASLMAVAGAVAAVVSVMVAADGQAKEFNKTLMDGASIADFAFRSMNKDGVDVTDTLGAARKASLGLARQFRGDAKEYAGVMADLNKAGLTFRKMQGDAETAAEAQRAFANHTKAALVWSKALGISTGEATETMGGWARDFGGDLQIIQENFAQITQGAMESGMGTKRFFTAVSQATSGMALYNIRMDEAANLLAVTSKILGDTDASDFIKSLTRGFVDESMQDRIKRVMIAGGEDTRRIMEKDALKTAHTFSETFRDEFSDANASALKDAGLDVDLLSDPKALVNALAGKSEKDLRSVIGELRRQGQDAAARQVESIADLAKGSKGSLDAQVKALDNLSMGGKLAMKMQSLGDRRLSEMSMVELAAFEQYAGISGEQLEQLMRIEQSMIADFEMLGEKAANPNLSADERAALEKQYKVQFDNGRILDQTGSEISDYKEYMAAQGDTMNEVASLQDEAAFFAETTVENTTSILSVLQTGIQGLLEQIHDVMLDTYNWTRGLSEDEVKNVAAVSDALGKDQAGIASKLEELRKEYVAQEKVVATKGTQSAEGAAAALAIQNLDKESKLLEGQLALSKLQQDNLRGVAGGGMFDDLSKSEFSARAQEDAIRSEKGRQILEDSGVTDYDARLAKAEAAKKAAVDAALAPYKSTNRDGVTTVQANAAGKENAEAAGSAAFLKEMSPTPVVEQVAVSNDLTLEQTAELVRARDEAMATGRDQISVLEDMRREAPNVTYDSMLKALKRADAEKIAAGLGLEGAQFTSAVENLMTGTNLKQYEGKLASADASTQSLAAQFGIKGGVAKPDDFILRPGQPLVKINPNDTLVGTKPGGNLATGGGGKAGGNVTINVNGGDTAQVYATVKSALKSSGLR